MSQRRFRYSISLYRIRHELGHQKSVTEYDSVPAIQFMKNSRQDEEFLRRINEAAKMIAEADLIILWGEGEGGTLIRYGTYLLECAGKMAFTLESGQRTACPKEKIRTLFFVLSASGDSEDAVDRIHRYKSMGVPVISITNVEQCPAARMSDVNFSCYMPEVHGKAEDADWISQIPAIYILEMLAAKTRSAIK